MKKILVVEDQDKLATVMVKYLQDAGFAPTHFNSGAGVVDWIKANAPAAILLDLIVPEVDGITLCREIRKFSDIPILMITAQADEVDRILGLELGADDYICKPFSMRELIARVRANLRYARVPNSTAPGNGGFLHLDQDKMLCSVAGKAVSLTAVEFTLLNLLAHSPGRVYSRAQLIDMVYSDHRIVNERTMDSHIKNLRRKLSAASNDHDLLHSIYGVGYKLELP